MLSRHNSGSPPSRTSRPTSGRHSARRSEEGCADAGPSGPRQEHGASWHTCFSGIISPSPAWGWQRKPVARGNAVTAFAIDEFDAESPVPDGMVGNMPLPPGRSPGQSLRRLTRPHFGRGFIGSWRSFLPVAEESRVRLAAHPDDPPVERLRGTARLGQQPRQVRPASFARRGPANALEFCVGSLAEMPDGDVYETTRRLPVETPIAYVHFRNVRGKVPNYVETFVDDGDVDMAASWRVLHEEGYDGILVPDHVPELECPAPWHAGHAYTIGYMKALVAHADALTRSSSGSPAIGPRNPRRLRNRSCQPHAGKQTTDSVGR